MRLSMIAGLDYCRRGVRAGARRELHVTTRDDEGRRHVRDRRGETPVEAWIAGLAVVGGIVLVIAKARPKA
jgi:hypothetical protein